MRRFSSRTLTAQLAQAASAAAQAAASTSGAGGTTSIGPFRVTAKGAIGAGEIVTTLEGGVVMRADPLMPLSIHNNNTPGLVSLRALTIVAGANNTASAAQITADRFANGNVLVTESAGFSKLMNTTGGLIKDIVSDVGGRCAYLKAIDQVVVIGLSATGGNFTAKWYDSTGTLQRSIPLFTAGFNPASFDVRASGTGGFAIPYINGSAGTGLVRFFDALGNQVGATVSVSGQTSQYIVPQANGPDFYLYQTPQGGSSTMQRYSGTTGAVLWTTTLTDVPGGASPTLYAGWAHGRSYTGFREIDNGNIVVAAWLTGNAGSVIVFDPNGNRLSTTAANGTAISIARTPAGFAVVSGTSSSFTLRTFDGVGAGIAGPIDVTAGNANAGSITQQYLEYTGSALVLAVAAGTNSYLFMFDLAGAPLGANITSPPVLFNNGRYIMAPDGVLSIYLPQGSGQLANAAFKVLRSSILGVSLAAIADGASGVVYDAGQYPLAASQVFAVGGPFDARANTLRGCRGSLGSGIFLSGSI